MRKYPNFTEIPNINGRHIVLDTETTGLFYDNNHILEIAAVEIKNGFLTGNQFHAYLKPRKTIETKAQEKHKMNNCFYKDNFENVYESDKSVMENLLNFVGDSLIFAHNASFDLQFLNHELNFWKLPEIPIENFRCTMRIFKNLFDNCRFKHTKGNTLSGCCQFFNIKYEDENLHTAVYDAILTAKLMNAIYEFLDKNPHYISKKIVSNFSYLLTKRDLYGMKNAYSFLNKNEVGKDNFNQIDLAKRCIVNAIENVNPEEEIFNSNENENEKKRLIIDNQNLLKVKEDFILKSAEKNNINKDGNFEVNNTNGIISTKKINPNQEMEILVYDTNTNNSFKIYNDKNINENSIALDKNNIVNKNILNSGQKKHQSQINLINQNSNKKEREIHVNFNPIEDDENIDYLKKIYGENNYINTISITNNLNNNFNILNFDEISRIEKKGNFSYEKNYERDDSFVKDIAFNSNLYNSFPKNDDYNNPKKKVSEFILSNKENFNNNNNINEKICRINNLNENQNLKNDINRIDKNILKIEDPVEEIGEFIEKNADVVLNIVNNLHDNLLMEVDESLDQRSRTDFNINDNKYLKTVNRKLNYENDDLNQMAYKEVFDICKINSQTLRNPVLGDRTNRLNYDVLENKKPRYKRMMKNFLNKRASENFC